MNLPPSLASTYSLIHPIGFGSYSTVYLAVHVSSKSYVAIKIISYEKLKTSNSMKDEKGDEVKILQKLSGHPFVTKIYSFTRDDNSNIYIVMEYVEGGNLLQMINLNCPPLLSCLSSLTSYVISMKKFAVQLYLILKHLDKNKIVHRDIKSENILIDRYNNLRLADFGLAVDLSNIQPSSSFRELELSSPAGTPQYIAPEIIRGQNYGRPADVWSTGVVLYCCAFGTFPFHSNNNSYSTSSHSALINIPNADIKNKTAFTEYHYNIFYSILNDDVTFPDGHLRNADLEDLIRKMLIKGQKERITVEEMGNHPFIKSASDLIEKVEQSFENYSFVHSSPDASLNVDNMILKRQQQTESLQDLGIIEQSDITKMETDQHKKIVHKVRKQISRKTDNPMAFLAKSIAHSSIHTKQRSSSFRERKKFV